VAASSPREVVRTFYQALVDGDGAAARACWHDDAVWHVTGTSEMSTDYLPDPYFSLLAEWAARYPDYAFTSKDVGQYDDVAVMFIESTGGMVPGRASGLMIYRVTEGKIAEGWAIPAFSDGRYLF
jgi:ketosteroid isomerase-like protein